MKEMDGKCEDEKKAFIRLFFAAATTLPKALSCLNIFLLSAVYVSFSYRRIAGKMHRSCTAIKK